MWISRFEVIPKPAEVQRVAAYNYWERLLGRRMCYICERTEIKGKKKTGRNGVSVLELHHIKPRSFGGTNNPDNLLPLCHKCHEKVHKKIYTFVEKIIYQMKNGGYTQKNGKLDIEVTLQISNYSQMFFAKIVDDIKQKRKNIDVVEFSKFFMEPDCLL